MYQFSFGHETQSKCQPGSIMTVLDSDSDINMHPEHGRRPPVNSINPILRSSSTGIVIKREPATFSPINIGFVFTSGVPLLSAAV